MRLVGGVGLAFIAATMSAQAQVQRCPDKLPPAVAEKRDAIVQAAQAKDWAALKRLSASDDFVYSFGDSGDPIGYWQDSLKQGTDVPQAMVAPRTPRSSPVTRERRVRRINNFMRFHNY